MKKFTSAVVGCFCLTSSYLYAGSPGFETSSAKETPDSEMHGGFPFEFDASYSYIGGGEVSRGRPPLLRDVHDLDEDYFYARFIYTPRVKFGILRLGAAYERFDFDASRFFEVPGDLQSLSAVVGLDTKFSDAILVRFEATPGFYSGNDLDGDDFHAPIVFGGTYIYSSDLQFVLGVSFDYEREIPVLPGGGIRWRTGAQWVINAVLPTPRLEFEMTRNVTLYAGADIKGSTFRVDDRYGFDHGDARLNHAVVTYTEVRAGAGFEWKVSPEVNISFEGGYMPYRNFDFYRADVRYHNEEGAPYASVAIHGAF